LGLGTSKLHEHSLTAEGGVLVADDDLIDTVRKTIIFLRMATIEMRRLGASGDPPAPDQLRHMADKCEAEANELSDRFGIDRDGLLH
jgi:hypothetical protein